MVSTSSSLMRAQTVTVARRARKVKTKKNPRRGAKWSQIVQKMKRGRWHLMILKMVILMKMWSQNKKSKSTTPYVFIHSLRCEVHENNFRAQVALRRIRETIQLDPSLPWTDTLVISYPQEIEVDVDDDLNRELAFYKQGLHAANTARTLAASHSLPFTRPSDYFAEMVKSDSHMERLRSRLLDERAGIKKTEEKRREREGKKFGKQVQMEKLKERERSKKDMEERLKGLKRKRKGALENAEADGADADAFDIAVEDAIADRPSKRAKGSGGKKMARPARDQKFGFGGQGRRSKQNTKASTDNFDSVPGKRGGHGPKAGRGAAGGSKRPGKSKRVASRSRK
ncbi:eukaryotic rRNA processing protein EBP2-domain-containing protein [Suillus ampliporus]|nr:eukaryotic rRNA processing protein EBP2-domain-containing protein [Suillus ampliporus]